MQIDLTMQKLIANSGDQLLTPNTEMLSKTDPRQRAWLEVNQLAIEANTCKIVRRLAKGCLLMAVVKADGYGHGAETVARAALRGGASNLGVATLQEGIELRQVGIKCPILVLGNLTHLEELASCFHWDLMPTISTRREAFICQNLADSSGRKFKVQVKVDTGMTRLGCDFQDAPQLIETINQLSQLDLQGVYSHLALADGDRSTESPSVTDKQQQKFENLIRTLPAESKQLCFHLANSAGVLRDESLHYDMVRVGLAIYGYSPFPHFNDDLDLEPVLSLKARVTLMREVPKGVGVSYGHRFITKRPSQLAVVSIGYADGVSRSLSGKISALFNGQLLPQVGAITMDQLVLDATDQPHMEMGSVVTLLGRDGDLCITPQQWCQLNGSIPWEVLCSFNNRLPRLVI